MRPLSNYVLGLGLWAQLAASVVALHADAPHAAVITPPTAIRPRQSVKAEAVVPTESGQIGVSPPKSEPTPANIEGHTKYLTQDKGTTKWIGHDPNWMNIKVTTSTKKNGEKVVATITKGVEAHKNKAGGIDIILSPAVRVKLESIAKQVTPCAGKRRRHSTDPRARVKRWLRGRAGPACGLADYVQRVGADAELQGSFTQPLTDQVYYESDSGYGSDPEADPGWEGDGGVHEPGTDTGHFADDDLGFFEGATEGEGAETVETVVIGSAEDAARIAAALAGGEAAGEVVVVGKGTYTVGSFLGFLWYYVSEGKAIPAANSIPKESIHRISSSKTKTTTTTEAKCPEKTKGVAACGDDCRPTSVNNVIPTAPAVVGWKCSEGKSKDCFCNPETKEYVDKYDRIFNQAIFDAMKQITEGPKLARIECGKQLTNVPSRWFVEKTSQDFCKNMMADVKKKVSASAAVYDIFGNKQPIMAKEAGAGAGAQVTEGGPAPKNESMLAKRSPPETINNYKEARFSMEWTPAEGDKSKKCFIDRAEDEKDLCAYAFTKMVKTTPCGTNQGSTSDRMTSDASIDLGCGKLTWHVDPQPKPRPEPIPIPKTPQLGKRVCHDRHKQGDVGKDGQAMWAGIGCRQNTNAGQTLKPGSKEIAWFPITIAPVPRWDYKIFWRDGCTDYAEQKLGSPVEGRDEITCEGLMKDNWGHCDNGGAGGYVDVGCVRYDFHAS